MNLSDIRVRATLKGTIFRGGGGGGVTDYDDLTNRPSVNNHVITGSKTGHDYNLANLEDVLIKELNPNITPGVNYPRLEHIKDNDDQIYKLTYDIFVGTAAGLVPRVLQPIGKVLSDSGNWVSLPTIDDLSNMTWTLLISQSGGSLSNYTSIGTSKYLVLYADYQGVSYIPKIYKISDLNKIINISGNNEIAEGYNWKVNGSYDDWEFHYKSDNTCAVKASYNGITMKVYGVV